jgi:hypothetical protein
LITGADGNPGLWNQATRRAIDQVHA